MNIPVVDAHVHFWDPAALDYPWLEGLPALHRPFLPTDYRETVGAVPVEAVVFVEANPRPDQGLAEARFVERLADAEPRLAGIVAFVDLADAHGLDRRLDALLQVRRLVGVRHNIQGNPPGFCLQPSFVEGVREVGRRGLAFDLCATHDQLGEVVELVRRCPETRMVLDHCGKPAIREGLREPWAEWIERLARFERVECKLSGLLTEADPEGWRGEELLPYAAHVAACFGTGRLMYGSDWPVLTLAGGYSEWYHFTRRFAGGWDREELARFYSGNALRFYDL